jgi:hypothetical protein
MTIVACSVVAEIGVMELTSVGLLRGEPRVQQQPNHPNHAIHRRADLACDWYQ